MYDLPAKLRSPALTPPIPSTNPHKPCSLSPPGWGEEEPRSLKWEENCYILLKGKEENHNLYIYITIERRVKEINDFF